MPSNPYAVTVHCNTFQLTNLLVAGPELLISNSSCVVVVQYSPSHPLFPHVAGHERMMLNNTCAVRAQYKTSHLAVPRVAGPELTTPESTGAVKDE